MKVGMFDHIEDGDRPLAQLFDERLQFIEAAEAAGIYSLQLAEHHQTPLNMVPVPGVLSEAVVRASTVALEKLPQRPAFIYTSQPSRGPALARISIQKSQGEATRLKEALSAQNNRELGEKSFDYAYSNLVEED